MNLNQIEGYTLYVCVYTHLLKLDSNSNKNTFILILITVIMYIWYIISSSQQNLICM